jgi:hypothetical protein
MSSLRKLTIVYPEHLWLKLPVDLKAKAWKESQNHSNATARFNAYLNYLCLNKFVPWLEAWLEEELIEESSADSLIRPSIFQEQSLSSIWEFINGMAIDIGKIRLVILPSETTDLEEFCVPQEWVDIPSWTADYYLAVQVNFNQDNSWLRLWGYVNHQQLKNNGVYDESDHSYYISQDYVDQDWKRMLSELKPVLTKRTEECSELELYPELAKELLEKLGNSSVYSPRLAVQCEHRFEPWKSLLANQKWREELYRRRINQWSPEPLLPSLHQWFHVNDIKVMKALRSAGWQRYGEVFDKQEAVALARRFKSNDQENRISWVKRIDSEVQLADYPIALIIRLIREDSQTIWILPQLHPIVPINREICLPEGLTLTVLNQSGEIFDQVQAGIASNFINLDEEFTDASEAKFIVRVTLEQREIVAINFVI